MEINEYTPSELIGPLNEVEQKHAPDSIFAAGDIGMLRTGARISIVGSRKASQDGIARARRLAKLLVAQNAVVVSGLAEGIDTAAHTAAIEAGGRTLAVIGTPLDKSYPKKNEALQKQIQDEHLLISQFPIGYPTTPKSFPMRNRTMALFSDATVIMEAANNSGSLHQGWEALRLGRSLFIAKAIVDDDTKNWTDDMLHYGARVLSNDSIEEFKEFLLLANRTEQIADESFAF